MNYVNRDELQGEPVAQTKPMAQMMKEVGAIACDVLQMAQKANIALFGMGNSIDCDSQKNDVSKCFMDELERTKIHLLMTANELKSLIDCLDV